MDADTGKRLAALMAENRETIVVRWTATLHETLRSRLTNIELSRQLEEIYDALQDAMAAGATTTDSPAASDLLRILADLSRSRARHGFTATETAISVFSIKDALYASLAGSDARSLADYAAVSSFIDKLGLFTFETYVNARDSIITEQAEQLLELSTPVVKLWDGVVAVPLIGTLDSARSQVVMERLL
ncbi:MAG TPA: RsbRD N-terminal domain-containing protein, partial [Micromonosporaceae bacterium]